LHREESEGREGDLRTLTVPKAQQERGEIVGKLYFVASDAIRLSFRAYLLCYVCKLAYRQMQRRMA
jgi:hypothetical protein